MKRIAALTLIALTAIAKEPSVPKPNVSAPERFEHQPAGAEAASMARWWQSFEDPLLNDLVDKASRANLDVRLAGARLAEASAHRTGTRSALLPSIDTSATASQLRGGYNQGVVRADTGSFVTPFETGLVSAGFNMRWEADIFGGVRKSVRAAAADQRAAAENIANAQVVVRAEVIRNYIEMRAAEEQARIVGETIAAEQEQLDLIRVRADAGLASDLDVERQAVQLASVRAILPDLDGQRIRAAHRIAVLVGEYPTGSLATSGPVRLSMPAVPRAVPSELLRTRPDIRRADAQIAAAWARAGAARADLYPKFVITGLSGRQATGFSGLTVGAGNFFSIGPGISLPIFNAGKIRSNIAAQDSRLEQAVRTYEQEVLAAFEETENAFVSRDRSEERRRQLQAGIAAAERSVALAQELYARGLADFLSVLDAQRQRLHIQRELAAADSAVLVATVQLYKALGR